MNVQDQSVTPLRVPERTGRRSSLFRLKTQEDEQEASFATVNAKYPDGYREKLIQEGQQWTNALKTSKREYLAMKVNACTKRIPDFNILDESQKKFLNAAPDYKTCIRKAQDFHKQVCVVAEMQHCFEECCKREKFSLELHMNDVEHKLKATK